MHIIRKATQPESASESDASEDDLPLSALQNKLRKSRIDWQETPEDRSSEHGSDDLSDAASLVDVDDATPLSGDDQLEGLTPDGSDDLVSTL